MIGRSGGHPRRLTASLGRHDSARRALIASVPAGR